MGDPSRSGTSNFYSILGIPKSASLAEISKAYKSLVMKWHPDKNNSSNKAEAQAKFTAINEAYRVLSTKKREEEFKIVDEPITPESSSSRGKSPEDSFNGKSSAESSSYRGNSSADESFFSRLSRSASRRSKTPTPGRGGTSLSRDKSKRSTTPTPADFYASGMSSSGGTASTPRSTPPLSPTTPATPTTPVAAAATPGGGGEPTFSKMMSRRNTPIIYSQSTSRRKPPPVEKMLACTLEELCNGCVKKIKITRDAISDTGMIVKEEEILKIRIKPGWKKGTKILFEGKGDQKPGTLPADIIFVIDEKRHPIFKREGDDLELGVEVPLVQALTGCSITVPLLGGEKMTLFFDDIIYPGYEKIILGQGMPKSRGGGGEGRKGDLRLKFLVDFPTELSDEQRSDILSILNDSF